MFKPGTNERDVQMSDVLCDFCHRVWTEDAAFIEGHRGAHLCGNCLTVALLEIDGDGPNIVRGDYFCRMSREGAAERNDQNRSDEQGWQSPIDAEAAVSRMCIRLAAAALDRDEDTDWSRPSTDASS